MTLRVMPFLTSVRLRDNSSRMIQRALRWSCLILLLTAAEQAFATAAMMDTSSFVPFGSLNTSPQVSLNTSLRIAAREGRIKTVKSLLENGADVNGTGEFGETALMGAARFNHRQVADLLLARGADVNLSDSEENTALIRAAMNCSHQISRKILAADANVNLISRDGRTALIHAAMNGCAQIVGQLLHTTGIDLNVVDESGRTALDHALYDAQTEVGGPYTDIARALRAAGAKTVDFQIIPRAHAPELKSVRLP